MIGIVGHWECSHGMRESKLAVKKLLLMWTTTAKAFGVKTIYMVSCDKDSPCPQMGDTEIDFKVFDTLDEVKAACPGHRFIYVTREGRTKLTEYRHPAENAMYVFGSDYGEIDPIDADESISIMDSPIPLYAHVASAIVLRDRSLKVS